MSLSSLEIFLFLLSFLSIVILLITVLKLNVALNLIEEKEAENARLKSENESLSKENTHFRPFFRIRDEKGRFQRLQEETVIIK